MGLYRKIVVGTDFSDLSEVGVRAATELAKRVRAQDLHVVHIAAQPPSYSFLGPEVKEKISDAAIRSQAYRERMADLELVEVSIRGTEVERVVRFGTPARELASYIEEIHANLLVVSSHGRGGVQRLVLGSVASDIIRASPCPTLVVGKERRAEGAFRTILAAVDLSPVSTSVLEHAVELAKSDRAKLTVLSLYETPILAKSEDVLPRYLTPSETSELGKSYHHAVQKLVDQAHADGVDVEIRVGSEDAPNRGILTEVNQHPPDLVVVGSSGHGAWHRMIIGSTADALLTRAKCPVLLIPHALAPESIAAPAFSAG